VEIVFVALLFHYLLLLFEKSCAILVLIEAFAERARWFFCLLGVVIGYVSMIIISAVCQGMKVRNWKLFHT